MIAIINNLLFRGVTAVSNLKVRLAEQRGQDLLEYALIGGFVALAIVLGFVLFDDAVTSMATGIADCIDFKGSTVCSPGP